MSYTCLVVDDEPLASKIISEYLLKLDGEIKVIEAGDALEAQKILKSEAIDILYLDINMPLMTGLELRESIDQDILTIFTTAYAEHAIEAFELAAFDYLLKPISFSRFQKSFIRATESIKSESHVESAWHLIKEGRRLYKVPYDEIHYLQAYGDYVKIHADSKVYLMKTRLSALAEAFPKSYQKIHRSYVVRLESISYLEGNHVVIGKDKIPISDGFKSNLLDRL